MGWESSQVTKCVWMCVREIEGVEGQNNSIYRMIHTFVIFSTVLGSLQSCNCPNHLILHYFSIILQFFIHMSLIPSNPVLLHPIIRSWPIHHHCHSCTVTSLSYMHTDIATHATYTVDMPRVTTQSTLP